MKACAAILLAMLLAGTAAAQQTPVAGGDDLLQSLNAWALDNLDERVLDALNQVDQDRVRQIFAVLQQRFAGTNLLELGSLKDAANRALPVLRQFEETRPYAEWLQMRLDYLETADELERELKRSGSPKTGALLTTAPLKLQREIWARQLERRPVPPAAKMYVPRLKEIFVSEKLPPELVWVAEVESSFNPAARSPAGAAGMFQLMPATARTLNLSLTPADERLQPEKNARAAAQYLRKLYARFGNWPLALAAYNSGESRVDKLLKQRKAKTFDSIARYLPAETQMYVPKIEATIHKREGANLSQMKIPKG